MTVEFKKRAPMQYLVDFGIGWRRLGATRLLMAQAPLRP
jgi:hypothetical protein